MKKLEKQLLEEKEMRDKLQKEMKVESRKQKKNQKTKIKNLTNS